MGMRLDRTVRACHTCRMNSIDFRDALGASIRSVREAQGLSLRALAERTTAFGLTLDHNALSRIERADRGLDVRELLVIAAALDVSPDVLVMPDGHDVLDITGALAEPVDRLRRWWSGRGPLLGSLRRSPRPSWPFPEELRADFLLERTERWRSHRPLAERRAAAWAGVPQLRRALESILAALGSRATPGPQDRLAAAEALIEAARGIKELLDAPGLRPTVALRAEAIEEMKAILRAAERATSGDH